VQNQTATQEDAASPKSDSSFDDAYTEQANTDSGKDGKAAQNVSVGDDYAMTFDSDEDAQAQVQDVSQANAEAEADASSFNVPKDADVSTETTQEASTSTSQNHPPSPSPQSLPQPTTTSSDEPITETSLPQSNQPLPTDTAHTSSYDDIASGGVDIQQLLDNITANAEKNEATTTQAPSITSPPVAAHASLPPRPQISQASPSTDTPMYAAQALFPPAASSYRPPGLPIGAGAPGTSLASMGGLPPPPGTSFSYPPQQPGTIEQMHIPLDHRDDTDNPEKRWGPEIQKLYDIFLDEERKNVTEGTWEKFPLGSRLFVGKLPPSHQFTSSYAHCY
jgi:nuclear polyadenylated RNA-binding protein 3